MQMDKMEMISGENKEDFLGSFLDFEEKIFQVANKLPIIFCLIFSTLPPPFFLQPPLPAAP